MVLSDSRWFSLWERISNEQLLFERARVFGEFEPIISFLPFFYLVNYSTAIL
jgi:hypothetical protein